MPSKKTQSQNNINTAEFGRKYYDVLEVYSQKIMSQIVEKSNDLNLQRETLDQINNILLDETSKAKNWGFDQLIKVVKG
tara:strand:+ start:413 stop:649 length:237 start_codon:yes stop_codon:yes gene_type:complete